MDTSYEKTQSTKMVEQNLQQELTATRQEVERLRLSLKELHHRCLNEWQVLAAIVENEQHTHPLGIVQESVIRILAYIQAVGETHRLLMQAMPSSREQVSLQFLLVSLCSLLQETHSRTRLCFEIEEVMLPQHQCCSLALICSELVCNAAKQGASQATILFRVCDNLCHFAVRDDGPGFPVGFDPKVSANTGLEVIETLCHTDLGGKVQYRNRRCGAEVAMTFPLP